MITTGLRNGSTKCYIIINMYPCHNRISASFGEANFVDILKIHEILEIYSPEKREPYGIIAALMFCSLSTVWTILYISITCQLYSHTVSSIIFASVKVLKFLARCCTKSNNNLILVVLK